VKRTPKLTRPRRVRTGLILAATAAVLAVPPCAAAGDGDSAVWRAQNRCAINSMYLFMRLHGAEVVYPTLEQDLPVHETGTSFAEMSAFARAHGVRTEVRKSDADQITRLRTPFIAHTEQVTGMGHYVVVMAVGRDLDGSERIEVVDGTTGIPASISLSEFKTEWTGYVLTVSEQRWKSPVLIGTAATLSATLLGIAVVRGIGRRRPAGRKPEPTPGVSS
jgi:hypothetical protein